MEEITIDAGLIDEDTLIDLVGMMMLVTSSKIEIGKSYRICSNNTAALRSIEALFGCEKPALAAPAAPKEKKTRQRKLPVLPPPNGGFLPLGTGAIVDAGSNQLIPEFQGVRDQVNKAIDQVVEKIESATFPARRKEKEKADEHREWRSWHVHLGGQKIESITISQKDERLQAGLFETGSQLHHPKAGWFNVVGFKGAPQMLELV